MCVCEREREREGCLISASSAERGSNSNRTRPLGTPSNSSTLKPVALYNGYYTALRPTKTEMASLVVSPEQTRCMPSGFDNIPRGRYSPSLLAT